MCEIQVALNYTSFLVSEISVFDKYQNTCLACAHVYVGCNTVLMNIPQKVIVVKFKSVIRYPKIPRLCFKCPWIWQQCPSTIPTMETNKYPICVVSNMGTQALASLRILLSKKLSLPWQLPRKSSFPITICSRHWDIFLSKVHYKCTK